MLNIFVISEDIPLAEVKIGELGGWLSRRNKSPSALTSAISRGKQKKKIK